MRIRIRASSTIRSRASRKSGSAASPWTIALGLTALFVLVPSLLYYGGGWWQFGYRYALDCFPFVLALFAMAAARRGIGRGRKLLILFGVAVNLHGVNWNYNP